MKPDTLQPGSSHRAFGESTGPERWWTPVAALLLALLVHGCGGDTTAPSDRVVRLQITAPSQTLEVGEVVELSARPVTTEGRALAPLPAAELQWQVTPRAIASVDGAGRVEGRTEGPATVTASRSEDGVSGSLEVEVVTPRAVRLSVAPDARTILETDTTQFIVGAFDRRGSSVPAPGLRWSVSDARVARVLDDGRILGLSPGETEVVASLDELGDTALLVVDPLPRLVATDGDVSFPLPGDSLVLEPLRLGEPVDDFSVELALEVRWLEELPVLDPEALSRGVLRAASPGHGRVVVSAPRSSPDTVRVAVEPVRPLVVSHDADEPVGDGDRIRLRGYELDQVDPDQVVLAGQAASVVSTDSATLVIETRTLRPSTCGGRSAVTVVITGADVLAGARVPLRREGDVDLAPGQAQVLSTEQLQCLRLPAARDAEYALAYADVRFLGPARTREPLAEQFDAQDDFFQVLLEEISAEQAGTVAPGDASTGFSPIPGRAKHAPQTRLSAGGVRHSATGSPPRSDWHPSSAAPDGGTEPPRGSAVRAPVRVGDRVSVRYTSGGGVESRVVAVYDEWLAIVVPVTHEDEVTDEVVGFLDATFELFLEIGVPLYRRTFWDGLPESVDLDGQFYVALDPFGNPPSAFGGDHVLIPLGIFTNGLRPIHLLAHEMGHIWHSWYQMERAGEVGRGPRPFWATEGLANFLADEVARLVAEVPLQSNFDWRNPRNEDEGVYAGAQEAASGGVLRGYSATATFLRQARIDLIRSGLGADASLSEVVRGAAYGWFGCDETGCRPEGLGDRMAALISGWTPEEALLRQVLENVADDRTPNPALTNPLFLKASSDAVLGDGNGVAEGWKALGLVETVDGSGGGIAPVGGAGHLKILESLAGPSYRLTTNDPESVMRWALVRIR